MKSNYLLLAVAVLISTTNFAQKAKIKQKNTTYNYTIYPELDGYEDLKTYSIKIVDHNGLNYSYSEGNTDAAKKAEVYTPLVLLTDLNG